MGTLSSHLPTASVSMVAPGLCCPLGADSCTAALAGFAPSPGQMDSWPGGVRQCWLVQSWAAVTLLASLSTSQPPLGFVSQGKAWGLELGVEVASPQAPLSPLSLTAGRLLLTCFAEDTQMKGAASLSSAL